MRTPDRAEFTADFLRHPNPIIYSPAPENFEYCQVVLPEQDGSFSNKSPKSSLGSFLEDAEKVRNLGLFWRVSENRRQHGLWDKSVRQALADSLNKQVTYFFDCPTIDFFDVPKDLLNPTYYHLEMRSVPILWGLWHDFYPIFSFRIPTTPTRVKITKGRS